MDNAVTTSGEPNFNFWPNINLIFLWYCSYINIWVKQPLFQFMANEFFKILYVYHVPGVN